MKENILQQKSYAFGIQIVKLYQFLSKEKKEFVLSKQILKSWTSVWALIREAEFWQSRADFVNKLSISLKEVNETLYWLDILKDTLYIDVNLYEEIHNPCIEILKILISTIKTTKINP